MERKYSKIKSIVFGCVILLVISTCGFIDSENSLYLLLVVVAGVVMSITNLLLLEEIRLKEKTKIES
ncbi:MAG: hypothetical protein PHY47_10965 [Lachnospiraceae bacterium]|jgi:hypothetical protein|nr:hypothetical protein [Lachnospiraceae bacterium]